MDADTRAYLDALIKPVADDVAELNTDVRADMKDMRKDIGLLQRFRAQAYAVLGVFLLAGTSGAAWVAMLR